MLKHHKKAAAASVLCLSLLLSACGNNTNNADTPLDKVQVDMNGATAAPSASFSTPFSVDRNVSRVIEEGSGEAIQDGDNILVEITQFNGTDGSSKDAQGREQTTYASAPFNITVNEQLKEEDPEAYETVKKLKVGGSFMMSSNRDPRVQPSPGAPAKTVSPGTPTNVQVITVKQKINNLVSGKAEAEDPKLPKFTLDEKSGKAEIKLPEDKGEEPKELVSKDLIVGSGEKVKETDNVYARYMGVRWSDGKEFENHYNADSAQPVVGFPLQQVIQGWQKGLVGKTVGSRVELIIPANLAYGEQAPENTKGALVFVIDIIDAKTNHSAVKAKEQTDALKKQAAEKAASASANPSGGAAPSQTPAPSSDGSASASASPAATEQKPSESASTK